MTTDSIPLALMISISSFFWGFFNFTSSYSPSPYLLFICCGVPMHWKLPLTIMPNREDNASAYSIEWVVSTTVASLFCVATLAMTFHMKRLALGSIPVEGSSKNTILGLPIIAIATDSFRLLPPDNVPESLSVYSLRSSSSILFLMAASFLSAASDLRS